MLQKIRLFFRYTIAWIIVIGCVALIGFVLYPLFSEKYNSIALPRNQVYTGGFTIQRWYPLEITRNKQTINREIQTVSGTPTKLDTIQQVAEEEVGNKTSNFFTGFKEAFSTNTNKKAVTYTKDETGVYRGE